MNSPCIKAKVTIYLKYIMLIILSALVYLVGVLGVPNTPNSLAPLIHPIMQ